ncbi:MULTISPECIES: hypothetical protein [Cellulomonas]|uniref:hypothetical protein n=1 Tax=Cellulomonas TaxID=1707 RepID=UPI0011776693|nr:MULTISPECIES: hypothetical protein [Cellulomonas]MBO9556721.1 hypothetical protein [Cellulomonas sp.]
MADRAIHGVARSRRRVAWAWGLGVTALLAAGCSTSTPDASPPPSASAAAGADGTVHAVRDCMQAAGWDVEVVEQPGGAHGLAGTYPDDQKSRYDEALATCQADNGQSSELPAMTTSDADAYYDALTTTAQCLRDEGHEPPAAPSRQAFIDAATRGDIIWNPYADFFTENLTMDEYDRVNRACPLP